MPGLRVIVLLLGVAAGPLQAGQAAFADDGKTVYEVDEGRITIVHTDSGQLSETTAKGIEHPEAISRAGKEAFYVVSRDALWRWQPGDQPAVLIERAGEHREFRDVAADPKTGKILVTGWTGDDAGDKTSALFYKPDADTPLLWVWLRHLPDAVIVAPEFLPDGTVLFSAEGDLWHGIPGVLDGDEGRPARGDLTAYRYAPVAERYTYSGTPSESGVRNIVYGAGHVYAQLGRIGGGESSGTLKLAAPRLSKDHSFTEHNEIRDSIQVLKSATWLSGSPRFLCASADRKKVYMRERDIRSLAVKDEDDGEPLAFRIGDKILIRK